MARLVDTLKDYLMPLQGRVVWIRDIREALLIKKGSSDDQNLRVLLSQNLTKEHIVSPSGRNDGYYKVIKQVRPVRIANRERKPLFDLRFPRDFDTGMEMYFASKFGVREGDMVLIAGQSDYGKTTLAMQFCGENIHQHPNLMGNEYTTLDGEPKQRFLERIDAMDWVDWTNGNGEDNFNLWPIWEDYAENIAANCRDSIVIIDWINPDQAYDINKIMEAIKLANSKGVTIICIQKSGFSEAGRGGQYTKDFADLEILLDNCGPRKNREVLLTIGKAKGSPISGYTYAYGIISGVKIINFREVQKCPACHGKGWLAGDPCDRCSQKGVVDVKSEFDEPF